MAEFLYFIRQMGDFAASFGLMKCLKGMICAMVILVLIGLIHIWNRQRKIWLNLYSFLLLFPMCFMGYSKLFFTGEVFRLSNWMYGHIRPVYGYLYFTVSGILFFNLIRKNIKLRQKIKKLPTWKEDALVREICEQMTSSGSVGCRYLSRVTVYRTKEEVSPFSGGVLHPYIVLPEKVITDWKPEELRIILLHEMLHICYGHILILFLFSLLEIYWWVNPCLYWAKNQLKEDMELFCDEKCLSYGNTGKKTYGTLILKMISLLQADSQGSVTAFLGKSGSRDFQTVKKRIGRLERANCNQKNQKQLRIAVPVILFGISCLVFVTSYPRYRISDTISLHDERGQLLVYDTPELRDAFDIHDEEITVDESAFKALLKDEGIQEEHMYLNFNNIEKTPAAGGCGSMAFIDMEHGCEVCFSGEKNWKNRLEEFFLKYLI